MMRALIFGLAVGLAGCVGHIVVEEPEPRPVEAASEPPAAVDVCVDDAGTPLCSPVGAKPGDSCEPCCCHE
jgi:hypothetical protein